jgi:hypothetical protein
MYMRKALATVLFIGCLHVILLSKVTLRYVTLFTKEMSHPFSSTSVSTRRNKSPEFLFIDLYVPVFTPRIHCSEALLQFAENMRFMFLCRVNSCIVHEQSYELQVL